MQRALLCRKGLRRDGSGTACGTRVYSTEGLYYQQKRNDYTRKVNEIGRLRPSRYTAYNPFAEPAGHL